MASLPAGIVTAVALFAGTNVDDVVVLSLLSASSRASGKPRRWEIWAGQYAGFAVLVGLSLAAGRGLALVPEHWLWLLALIPFAVGIVSLWTPFMSQDIASRWFAWPNIAWLAPVPLATSMLTPRSQRSRG